MTASLPELRVMRPRDVAEAVAARRENPAGAFLAGGTDLLVNLRRGLDGRTVLIDLTGVEELAGIERTPGGLRIGVAVTLAKLAASPAIAGYRALADAARAVAGPGHRAMGTVGGNLCLDTRCIYYNQSEWWRRANGFCLEHRGDVCHVAPQGQRCHAAFTGDLAPALLVFGTEIEIAGAHGRRRIPLDELYAEDGRAHLTLASDEIVLAVHLPPDPSRSGYAKARFRGAIDYPLAGVASALATNGEAVTALRIALTGTNSRPFLLDGVDALLGRPIDENALHAIDRLVQKQVQPMRTTIASAHYRRLAAAALARRLVAQLASTGENAS
jgi:4-hydroxybenzoyl-CoA reductase subunit beta